MNPRHRKDLHLSLSDDQFDDLLSALESHRNYLQGLAEEAANGFGLGAPYWGGRVNEVQELIVMVQHLGRDDETR
ncbi:hypothetical protein [Glutamicibacter protophormiae]|uniref:hypothetical protein n=1 Tax=Glutamicibacter protophormiae TaxID=37930 RepID=UPI00195CC4F3|nr:hypothetical protein [Glutamicibacter protophormiae]QRQ78321.1 hypothetical protein JQN66_15645 [Glutamicibacter protophormiae]